MTYEETVELEKHVKVKIEADEIYWDFMNSVRLEAKSYNPSKDRFIVWSDSNNAKYIKIVDGKFVLQCRYLNNTYDMTITPSDIFGYINNNYQGLGHLKNYIRSFYTVGSK